MKTEEFCELFGEVNETYVNHARTVRKRVKRPVWIPLAATAACLCLVVWAILYLSKPREPVAEYPAPVPCVAPVSITPWEEREIYEQYFYLHYNETEYGSHNKPLTPELVGMELGQAEAYGTEYTSTGEKIKHTTLVSVYEIKNISSACALAVQFEEVDAFYLYTGSWYRPDTLGQFITDLNLNENLSFGNIYYSWDHSSFRFEGIDPAVVWELLLSEPDAKECYNDFELHLRPKDIMGISISYPLFGIQNVSLSVCEDGYIKSNLLGTGKLFYIGEEKTEAFMDYVWNNCTVYETPYNSNGPSDPSSVPSSQSDGASSPSYHP